MNADPVKDYVLTSHAHFEMERRGLNERLVRQALEAPAQRWEVRPGRRDPCHRRCGQAAE
jgi:hypothetical protein